MFFTRRSFRGLSRRGFIFTGLPAAIVAAGTLAVALPHARAGGPNPHALKLAACPIYETSGYVLAEHVNEIKTDGTYTFEAWIKPFKDDARDRCVFQNSSAPEDRNGMNVWEGHLRFGYSDGSRWTSVSGDVELNTWQHVAGVNDEGRLLLYINGERQWGSENVYVHEAPGLYIGRNTLDGDRARYGGLIDEVRIWDHARSAEDIRADMNRKLAGSENGLIGYWRFDEGKGTTAADSSSRGNNATLEGNAGWAKGEVELK